MEKPDSEKQFQKNILSSDAGQWYNDTGFDSKNQLRGFSISETLAQIVDILA